MSYVCYDIEERHPNDIAANKSPQGKEVFLKGMDMDTGSNSTDPFEGTWKLNFAKSDLKPFPASVSIIDKVQAQGNNLQIKADPVALDGRLDPFQGTELLGSRDRPIPRDTNPFGASSMECKRVNGNIVVVVFKRGGKELGRSLDVVSEDGKTITRTLRGKNAQGEEVEATVVYEKQ